MTLTVEGLTVIHKIMIEHNLFVAAKMYNNITFVELGFFLHVDPDKTEEITHNISSNLWPITGSIDQIDVMIYFTQVRLGG